MPGKNSIWYGLAVVLVVVWLLLEVVRHLSGVFHLLLIAAVVVIVWNWLQQRRAA
jgi:hypothetical protein